MRDTSKSEIKSLNKRIENLIRDEVKDEQIKVQLLGELEHFIDLFLLLEEEL